MNDGPKHLLCIVGIMNADGAETFLMKMMRNLDKNKYQMDYCVTSSDFGYYDEEIEKLGGEIFHIIPKTQNVWKNFIGIEKIVRNKHYKYVMRVSQHSLSAVELIAARFGGAKVVVYRSSNSNTCGGKLNTMIHYLCRFIPRFVANVRLAPSIASADFMFGKNIVKKGKAVVLSNGLDTTKYYFNMEYREKIRKEFGVEKKFVIGHVGRFSFQKNHSFLLEIFAEIAKTNQNAILMLVGKGELEYEIKYKAKKLGIEQSIIFTGIRPDVPEILCAMDVFVFPSFYEGMPNTVIEAQATGLSCIVSDTITKEADITGLLKFLPLGDVDSWAKNIMLLKDCERKNTTGIFKENGYDIIKVTKKFTDLVFFAKQ
jgi:glycosyltransferase involved in cell wall biosynthesis